MSREVTHEMQDGFRVSGPPDGIRAKLRTRYDGLLNRVSLHFPYRPGQNDARLNRILEDIPA